jgi:hypothetical protein
MKIVHFAIGRLCDFDIENKRYHHWTKIRELRVAIAQADPLITRVDTEDLNDGQNGLGRPIIDDLHYSVEGCKALGGRFTKEAIERGAFKT